MANNSLLDKSGEPLIKSVAAVCGPKGPDPASPDGGAPPPPSGGELALQWCRRRFSPPSGGGSGEQGPNR
ncbi:hypothetical protein C2845_PM03G33490 [Panicum miliaceum]|uniref:Uncharacterized protein n=1 Tax=Panicum miliaceum TaxID=4540 RepID=A0A3L6T862_PANMI|nr:hypothetical protein C2845_PM03G33490 [Panicum miliaceum]